jgi:hypothetical protein
VIILGNDEVIFGCIVFDELFQEGIGYIRSNFPAEINFRAIKSPEHFFLTLQFNYTTNNNLLHKELRAVDFLII